MILVVIVRSLAKQRVSVLV